MVARVGFQWPRGPERLTAEMVRKKKNSWDFWLKTVRSAMRSPSPAPARSKSPAPRSPRGSRARADTSAGADSGVYPCAGPRWSWWQSAKGACGWLLFAVLVPLLVGLALFNTLLDSFAAVLRAGRAAERVAPPEGATLVFPGTCTWALWQMGMTLYLVENYDLRAVRIVGVSSGAICAAVVL